MSLPTRSRFLRSLAAPSRPPPAGFTCGICMETPRGELAAPHGNKHVYCRACLTYWLRDSNNCPLCRKVLFRKRQGRMTREQHRRLDSVRLRSVLGWNYYEELLRSEVVLPGLVTFYLEGTLTRLGQRWEIYDQGRIIEDITYNIPTTSAAPSRPVDDSVPSSDDEVQEMEVEEETFDLQARRLITACFAGWWETFTSSPQGAAIHHPCATDVLKRIVEALYRWDGYHVAGTGLRCMLRIRLTRDAPEEWEPYLNEVVEEVVRAFEGLTQDECKLSSFQRKALEHVEAHEPLWRAHSRVGGGGTCWKFV